MKIETAYMIDVSGGIYLEWLESISTLLLQKQQDRSDSVVAYFTTKIEAVAVMPWWNPELLYVARSGRGGTDFISALREIRDTYSPSKVVVWSDGYFSFPAPQEIRGLELEWFLSEPSCVRDINHYGYLGKAYQWKVD